jgi:hypothetical protein
MDLKDALRRTRNRRKAKEPFSPALFAHVGGLVRRHRLGKDFCRLMGLMTEANAEKLSRTLRAEDKPPYEAPLFFLATSEEYEVIQKIIAGLDNPYLISAHSPEEMLLSPVLWRQRRGLDPEALTSRHYAALL